MHNSSSELSRVYELAEGERVSVLDLYNRTLARRGYKADESQLVAVDRLQRLQEEWLDYKQRRRTALHRLLVRPRLPRGVSVWGSVGRGKSFLMDSFYLSLPLDRKCRVHFHHFMRDVHRELKDLEGNPRSIIGTCRADCIPISPDLL